MTRYTSRNTLARRVAISLWFLVAGVAVAIAGTIYGHSNPAMPVKAYTPLMVVPAPTTTITEPPIVVTPTPAPLRMVAPRAVAPHTAVQPRWDWRHTH